VRRGSRCDTAKRDACNCLTEDRVGAYWHTALLLCGPVDGARNSVLSLAAAIEGCRSVPYVDEEKLHIVSTQAADTLMTAEGRTAFGDEREALYGGASYDPFANSVPPLESTYLGAPGVELTDSVRSMYATAGYRVPRWLSRYALDHAAIELDFMAFCLAHSSDCGPHYADVAQCFFTEHIALWMVLFAAVTTHRATNPVLEYAGLALDKFVVCESFTFRHSESDVRSLHDCAAQFVEHV